MTRASNHTLKRSETISRICKLKGCDNPHHANGYCGKHNARNRRTGSPLTKRSAANGEPLSYVMLSLEMQTDKCILWPYALDDNGYAIMGKQSGLESKRVSRVVLELKNGKPKNSNFQAAHSPQICHNPSCINHRHLRWASASDNKADEITDGTCLRGMKNSQCKLTPEEVIEIRNDKRVQRVIAKDYGLHQVTVSNIKLKKSWGWLIG